MAHAEPGGDDGHQGIGPGMAGVIVLLVLLFPVVLPSYCIRLAYRDGLTCPVKCLPLTPLPIETTPCSTQ